MQASTVENSYQIVKLTFGLCVLVLVAFLLYELWKGLSAVKDAIAYPFEGMAALADLHERSPEAAAVIDDNLIFHSPIPGVPDLGSLLGN